MVSTSFLDNNLSSLNTHPSCAVPPRPATSRSPPPPPRPRPAQVTALSARLLSDSTGRLLSEWRPPGGRHISVVTANRSQLACAVGSELFYLEIESGEVVQKRSVEGRSERRRERRGENVGCGDLGDWKG